MANIDLNQLLQWQGIATQLIAMGVKSFSTIRALMVDAGVDDAVIAALEPKWNALHDDVARAAAGQ